MNTLHRRDFLKLATLACASGVVFPAHQAIKQGVSLFTDPQIRFGRQLLRGTSYGAILLSSDEGRTWEQVANFGECHVVIQFMERNKRIYANLGLGSHNFWLRSANAQKWLTV